MSLVVTPVSSLADWREALALRHEVFVLEQKVSEELETDRADLRAFHVVARLAGKVVGTGRLLLEPDGELEPPPDEAHSHADHVPRATLSARLPRLERPPAAHVRARIGRMAVDGSVRREGVGRALLGALEGEAWRRDITRVVLAAQVHALPFYAGLGYSAVGAPFQEAGISHQWMEKRRRVEVPPAP